MKRGPHSSPVFAGAGGPSLAPLSVADELLNVVEAAIYLRKFRRTDGKPSVGAIRNLVYRGLLKAYKPFGRLLFKKSELVSQVELSGKER